MWLDYIVLESAKIRLVPLAVEHAAELVAAASDGDLWSQDGVLRNHQKLPNGTYRDTVVFSILNSEWAGVKVNLEYRLQKYQS